VATFVNDDFERAVVAELQQLRKSEKMLQSMYPRLKSMPQLRTRFLDRLAEMQQRAQRLDAVLNPVGALQYSRRVAATVNAPMSAVRTPVA
jgi:ferritin-like metal-binding protein YciE